MSQRVGDSRLVFGVLDEIWGYMRGKTHEKTPEMIKAKRGDGEVPAVEFFNAEEQVTGNFLFVNGVSAGVDPFELVGTNVPVTIDGISGNVYVRTITKTWAVDDWKIAAFEGTIWPNLIFS